MPVRAAAEAQQIQVEEQTRAVTAHLDAVAASAKARGQEKLPSALANVQAPVIQLRAIVEEMLLKLMTPVVVSHLIPAPPGGALWREDAVPA